MLQCAGCFNMCSEVEGMALRRHVTGGTTVVWKLQNSHGLHWQHIQISHRRTHTHTDKTQLKHYKTAEQSWTGSSSQLKLNKGLAPLISLLFICVCRFIRDRGSALRAPSRSDFWKNKKGARAGTAGEHAAAALCTRPESFSPRFLILLLP